VTRQEIIEAVNRILREIAPEADLGAIRADLSLRDQIDLDSMDFLNFVIGLHKRLGVEIPEADYPRLATLNGCVDYLMAAAVSKQNPSIEQDNQEH
jgi:acyl carrier protein